jgi:hypothetical protein
MKALSNKVRWKPDTTRKNSLRLLAFAPDRVGETAARADFRLQCINKERRKSK